MPSKPAFKHCVIVINHASTHTWRSQRFIKQLENVFGTDKTEVIEVLKRDYDEPGRLAKLLESKLDQNTLLGIAGGDGTISFIVNILLHKPGLSAGARKAVLLPLWGGNANDLAYMANGLAMFSSLEKILEESETIEVKPLVVKIDGNESRSRLAVCYASFGASAYATHLMSHPRHRYKRVYRMPGSRLFFEAGSVMKALTDAKMFECEIDGVIQPLYDLMLINGSRIAKINRAPIKLTDPYFYEIRTKRKKPVVLSYFASLLRNVTPKHAPIARRSLVLHDGTWAQLDGEVEYVQKGSRVTVEHHDKPLRLLATRLKQTTKTDA